MTPCPCESGLALEQCCAPIISGDQPAATAESLMRSRYTAFVLKDEAYLRHSWHPSTCPEDIGLDDATRWLGLKIKHTQAGGEADDTGSVEFVARFKVAGKGHRLHEISQFVRLAGRWVYRDGQLQSADRKAGKPS